MSETAAPVARTVKGFCQAYGISRASFYRLVDDGKLTVVKSGSRTLVRESDAQAWMDRLPVGTNKKQSVYFIQSVETRAIKIGVSTRPEKRLKALQTAHGRTLLLLGTTKKFSEQDLHKRFKEIRSGGEWFQADVELLRFLREHNMHPLSPIGSDKPMDDLRE